MSRQATLFERELFEIIKEYNTKFYYEGINREVVDEQYKILVEKKKEEMVGRACVTMQSGRLEYEIRYNRIVNLSEGYTLLVPGTGTIAG